MPRPALRKTPGSSFVSGVAYDPDTSTLYIEFIGGKTFSYDDVPASIYDALMHAGSMGQFFHGAIKDQYTARRV